MMRLIIVNCSILLLLMFFYSCSYKSKNNINSDNQKIDYNQINTEYVKTKEFFDNQLINHFPEKINTDYITYTASYSPEAGLIRLDLITKYNSKTKELFKYKKRYSASDTCLLIVNRFADTINYSYNIQIDKYDSLKIDRNCYIGKYPVPNFWHNEYTTNETDCKLPADFSIFVIEAKSGKYLKDELLTDGRFMPKEWENGYSKGYAISEKRGVIIYWMIAW